MPDRLTGRSLVIASGHDLSLALLMDGAVLAEADSPLVRGHAEALVPAVADLLRPFGGPEAGLSRILVEVGPGSFTGLRVGIAAALALGLALSVPVFGVSSTRLVAAAARARGAAGKLLVALLAPRGQIWVEPIRLETLASLGAPVAVEADEQLETLFPGLAMTGSGAGKAALESVPRAAWAAHLSMRDLVPPMPLYVRVAPKLA
jgi:tRNA threonylcarbamoyl adenosine modification protein YeaZ